MSTIINYRQPGDDRNPPLPRPDWAAIDAAAATLGLPVTAVPSPRVRLANCPHCWQRPGRPCTIAGPAGDHLARWQRAERRGLIGREDLAAVVAGLEVIAGHVIITGGAL